MINKAVAVKKRSDDMEDGSISDCYWADEADIEEWEVDVLHKNKVIKVYSAGMLLDDGSLVEPKMKGWFNLRWAAPFRSKVTQLGEKVPFYGNRPIVRVESTVSQDHANKLASEQRQEWMRSQAFGHG